jgi:hypothetical protein
VVFSHVAQRLRWKLGLWGLLPQRTPLKIDLSAWDPPDSKVAREADAFLREVSSPQMVAHCLRSYYFSGALYTLSKLEQPIDREALYVGAILHDVALCKDFAQPNEHCFTVASAREARRIATAGGWDEARQDKMAAVIVSNLNPRVAMEEFGVEAFFMSQGGRVEVVAQEWKLHPENLSEVLERYPRDGFVDDVLPHIEREMARNPGCRFDCLDPMFPFLVRHSRFSAEGE